MKERTPVELVLASNEKEHGKRYRAPFQDACTDASISVN